MKLFDTLNSRGFVYQSTNLEIAQQLIDNKVVFYLGIDPTADSLHIGHMYTLMMFRRLQQQGHRGILLFGGATAMIGDPSGKQDMRQIMSKQQIDNNIKSIVESAKKFVSTQGDDKTVIVNNSDWLDSYNFVDFMRDIGAHFNINKMLSAEAYASRIDSGLTFLEMSYMLMQAYDFVVLRQKYNCTLQIGGSDQWGNIVAGTMLYRKLYKDEICGLTCPLLLTKDGKKMGKTEKGTIWLDSAKTSPYDFYQYFYNIDDSAVDTLLKIFTDIPLQDLDTMLQNILKAKQTMAYELTALVHGKAEADKAVHASTALFGSGTDISNTPSIQLPLCTLQQGINITTLCVQAGITKSTSQARQLIQDKAIFINGQPVDSIHLVVGPQHLQKNVILLKKGKKVFLQVIFC